MPSTSDGDALTPARQVIVCAHPGRPEAMAVAGEVAGLLCGRGVGVVAPADQVDALLRHGGARVESVGEGNCPELVVVLGGVGVGLIIGFLWEWIREHKHRSEAAQKAREARRLDREVKRLKKQKHEGKDEVLALLDDAG